MAHGQYTQGRRHAEQDEAVFDIGMIRILKQEGLLVQEGGLSFLKRDPVLP